MNFSVVIELACIVAYITVLFGGRGVRESGWKMLGGLLGTVAVSQMIAMALVVGCKLKVEVEAAGADIPQAALYENDKRFFVGWELDKSWILCTVSWIVMAVDAIGITAAAFLLPRDDDYEPIPDYPQ